jgi:hypothetical protein
MAADLTDLVQDRLVRFGLTAVDIDARVDASDDTKSPATSAPGPSVLPPSTPHGGASASSTFAITWW